MIHADPTRSGIVGDLEKWAIACLNDLEPGERSPSSFNVWPTGSPSPSFGSLAYATNEVTHSWKGIGTIA